MAIYDLEEQEKIDALKAWWKENGKFVLLVLIAAAVAFAAARGWRYYQESRAIQAATLYSELEKRVESKEAAKIRASAEALIEQYPSSPYAARAALIASHTAYDTGDLDGAKAKLRWAMEQAQEEAIRDLARLRLAAVLYDQKSFDEALALLDAKHGKAFDGLYAELTGDVLAAQGKTAEARAAYKTALAQTEGAYRSLIEIKLDALGPASQ
jgi:predicted negative regulator of RcsB-dependent stress response